jgi:hypothetical protein
MTPIVVFWVCIEPSRFMLPMGCQPASRTVPSWLSWKCRAPGTASSVLLSSSGAALWVPGFSG